MIEKHKTKTPFGSHMFGSLNNNSNQASGSTANQGYSKPPEKTGVDDMVSKMSVMPKEQGNGAMKPPKK